MTRKEREDNFKRAVIILYKNIKERKDGLTWEEITEIIKTEFVIKNWYTEVRNPLQYLINEGFIKRTDSVIEERYILTYKSKKGETK